MPEYIDLTTDSDSDSDETGLQTESQLNNQPAEIQSSNGVAIITPQNAIQSLDIATSAVARTLNGRHGVDPVTINSFEGTSV